jgi:hypothetical protein
MILHTGRYRLSVALQKLGLAAVVGSPPPCSRGCSFFHAYLNFYESQVFTWKGKGGSKSFFGSSKGPKGS